MLCEDSFSVPIPPWVSEALGEWVSVNFQLGDLARERGTYMGENDVVNQ